MRFIAHASIIAAVYVLLTYISFVFGLASGAVQLRISEALTVLPMFIPAAVPGLFVGCVIANLLSGCAVWDVIFGSIATFAAAYVTKRFAQRPLIGFISPVFFNTLIVPPVVYYVYGGTATLIATYIGVFAGEVLSVGIFGSVLYYHLKKTRIFEKWSK